MHHGGLAVTRATSGANSRTQAAMSSIEEGEMSFGTIAIERAGRSACIRLDRPHVLNAINDAMIREINQAASELEHDADVWTIILTGTGRALCAGADVNKAGIEEKGNYTSGLDLQGERILGSTRQWNAPQEATVPYLEMTKPMICAVNGICAGAGLDLVTTSDIVIASHEATFFDPHVSIGVVSAREAIRLARVLPLNITLRLALMGKHERLSAQRAYELGLVSELVTTDKLMTRAWEIAEVINRNAPLAVRGTRLAIRKTLSLPTYEAELLAENYRMKVAVTEDAQEGPRAFLEKREPRWNAN
jgi:enoyl-CoA hydratase/carnithine racemase